MKRNKDEFVELNIITDYGSVILPLIIEILSKTPVRDKTEMRYVASLLLKLRREFEERKKISDQTDSWSVRLETRAIELLKRCLDELKFDGISPEIGFLIEQLEKDNGR